jgi:hypothetical protein
VPFVTDRFQPNLHYLQHTRCKRHFDVSVTPVQYEAKEGWKSCPASRVNCPSLRTNFNPISISCSACAVSTTCDISVTPLQSQVTDEEVSAYLVKCPSLPIHFNQTCTACSARAASATCDV